MLFLRLTCECGTPAHESALFACAPGLARAFAAQGMVTKAKTAYQDFLAVWKDADPGIPVLSQAKAEYAKLQ
jgi:23S rRNA G2445 N2-methylase RlmL